MFGLFSRYVLFTLASCCTAEDVLLQQSKYRGLAVQLNAGISQDGIDAKHADMQGGICFSIAAQTTYIGVHCSKYLLTLCTMP